MEAHAEILSNPTRAVREGVCLAATGDFTAFDVENSPEMATPFCSRTRLEYEEIPRFLGRLCDLGLIERIKLGLDYFDPYQLDDQGSQLACEGMWTASDPHSRRWLESHKQSQAEAVHRAMMEAKEGAPLGAKNNRGSDSIVRFT